MNTPALHYSCIRFGIFEFNPHTGELRKQGLKVKLWPQATRVLSLLLQGAGEVCAREQLENELWPKNTPVDSERGLNKAVHLLRIALGDSPIAPRYIETIAGVGYRFIPMVQEPTTWITRTAKIQRIDSLAVLPLATDLDPEVEFLNKSIVERIIDTISQKVKIGVLAYSTVQRYRKKDVDPCTAGRELLVDAVTGGEIVKRNDELHMHLELIDTVEGTQIWGTQFKEVYSNVLSRPEELADMISRQLIPVLTPNESTMDNKGSERAA
jgi:DNA-binding winged helix-turn-helix (wHTH) protein